MPADPAFGEVELPHILHRNGKANHRVQTCKAIRTSRAFRH